MLTRANGAFHFLFTIDGGFSLGTGESGQGLGLVIETNVGVTHRHPDIAVPGHFLRLGHGGAMPQQARHVPR
jgi:hypothetical protein